MKPNKIKAIIFDMDGVLIDAREWHYKCLNQALACFGESIDPEDHLSRFDGLPTKKKLEILTEEERIPKKIHSLINDLKQKFTINYIHQECSPVFHHEYALSKLKKNGFSIGLASNSIRDTVDLMMSKSNLIDYFDIILSASDVVNPKPDPEIYITAIDKLGLTPEQCLIVEDNHNGIVAAKEANAHVMEVNDTQDVTYKNIIIKLEKLN